VYHFSPLCNLTPQILDRLQTLDYTRRFDSVRLPGLRGELFAETHVSTKSAPSPQNTRFSHAHEDCGRPQSFGGPTQKGTPSSYAHLEIRTRLPVMRASRGRVFPAPCVC
jgi:hypothetical protein